MKELVTLHGLTFAVMSGVAITLSKLIWHYINPVALALTIYSLTHMGSIAILLAQGKFIRAGGKNFRCSPPGDLPIWRRYVNNVIKHRLAGVDNLVVAYYNSGICFVSYLAGAVWTGNAWPLPQAGRMTWLLIVVSIALQVGQYLTYYRSLRDLTTWLVRILFLITPSWLL